MRISSIKDKNNLLTFNQWSCGEYLNNTQGFLTAFTTLQVERETNYLKVITIDSTHYCSCSIHYELSSFEEGKTLTVSSFVLPTTFEVALEIFIDSVWKRGVVSSNLHEIQHLTLSYIIPENVNDLLIRWDIRPQDEPTIFYLKNISLNIQ